MDSVENLNRGKDIHLGNVEKGGHMFKYITKSDVVIAILLGVLSGLPSIFIFLMIIGYVILGLSLTTFHTTTCWITSSIVTTLLVLYIISYLRVKARKKLRKQYQKHGLRICPTCTGPMYYFPIYSSWYCYRCFKYVPAVSKIKTAPQRLKGSPKVQKPRSQSAKSKKTSSASIKTKRPKTTQSKSKRPSQTKKTQPPQAKKPPQTKKTQPPPPPPPPPPPTND